MNQILLNEERESSVQGLNCQGKISIKGDCAWILLNFKEENFTS